jgi:hypothetical protein
MPSNRDLVQTCTLPMIEQHLRTHAEYLSLRHRLLARGSLHSQIGKNLFRKPGCYAEAVRHLLASVVMGYRPLDGLRELLYHAPMLRDMKRLLKRLYQGKRYGREGVP